MLKNVLCCLCLCLVLGACGSSEEKSVDYYNKALAYYESGDVAEAKIEAKNAVKLDPKNAKAFLLLGNCAVKEQNWRNAFGAYGQAVELDPKLYEAQMGLGRIYLLSRQYEKAEEIASLVLEAEPGNTDAHLLRAGVLLQIKDYEGAQRILQAILVENPDNTDAALGLVTSYEKMGNMKQALKEMETAIGRNPKSLTLLFKAASMAETAEDYATAEQYYNSLLHYAETKAPVQLMIARLYEKSGQTDKAEKTIQKLVQGDPENLDYPLNLAAFYLRKKDYGKSLAVTKEILAKDPENVRVKMAQVDILLAQKEIETAKAELETIISEHPDHPLVSTAQSKLGAMLLREKKYDEALAALDSAIMGNASPEYYYLRARIRLEMKDIEGAIADLRIVRKELPDHYEARDLLARAYLAQDKGLMAVEELHDILDQNANYSPSRNLLVKYYARYGQWELAEQELAKLLEQTPDSAPLLIAMGDVKRMRGQDKTAELYYSKALDVSEEKGPAQLRLGMMAEAQKKFDKAIGYYDDVLFKHPKSAAAIERKFFALNAAGKKKELKVFKSELERDMPENPVLHDMYGRLALSQKNLDEAEKQFRTARSLAPEWGVPYQRLIGIYLASNQQEKVIEECRVALDKNPDSLYERFLLGQIYQVRGDESKAQEAYEAVLEVNPKFSPAANNLAYLYAENHNDQATLEKALELAKIAAAKGSPEALDTLGWLYHLLGNREQSIETLHKAYDEMPQNKTIAYHLASVLAKWAYTSEARRIVHAALADGGDFPEKDAMEKLLKEL
ncbi:tetratricopeptide repeat protein [Pseudodesulfovibrio sp. zrk46]|uniref:tetratricopeptide repeat protein n=1 Tax=Pseudodesulfovibrio sp. zrk46 TaxID=2725288 RepID=UPI0014490C7E|nr:tetratricopeptide repeat protein [Pseudodesulfovibrio sp. zrk46]QJB55319.1 tetratricopeptide repeat protein [Pseudodesulfovibrio sp. zrk46]